MKKEVVSIKRQKWIEPEIVDEVEVGKLSKDFVACVYDGKYWVGQVLKKSNAHDDVLVSFMHPGSPTRKLHWPYNEDLC